MQNKYANDFWYDLLNEVRHKGQRVICRGHEILEIQGLHTAIPMWYPLITNKDRHLGYRFACAEAAWTLSGDNRVETIEPYSKMIKDFSNDGVFYYGSYGPKIIDQIEYIGRAMIKDINTRQAVITIWREKPATEAKDIPCTISVQFLVRNNRLDLFDNMRSSDSWLGTPYDWFTFSMLGIYFCLYFYKISSIKLELGFLHFYTASQHIYTNSFGYSLNDIDSVLNSGKLSADFQYQTFDPYEFESTTEFVNHLWSLARDKKGLPGKKLLKELTAFWKDRS